MKKISIIHIIAVLALLVILSPIIYLLLQVFRKSEWVLRPELLWIYSRNTIIMACIVGVFTGFFGSVLAWIVSFYDFPFRKVFKVLLALPLAIPPYIAAHSYADFTYNGGLFHRFTKWWGNPYYFDMMNFWGAIFIYCITLYPYVYLMCLSFYKDSSAVLIDNARILKASPWKLFFKVGLPLARLPIVSGVTLALMELVSDFGVVDYYGVQAFSTGIYKTWLSYSDFYGAIRLSAILLIIILSFVLIETALRRRLKFFTSNKSRLAKLIPTNICALTLIYLILIPSLLLCFGIPLVQLFYNAHYVYAKVINKELLYVIWTTFKYSAFAAIACVTISLIVANMTIWVENRFTSFISKLATMGYSVPGVIIGLAVIFTFIDLDKNLLYFYRSIGINQKTLVLSTSIFALIFAYIVRFLAVSYNNVYSGYRKLNPNILKAGFTLGKGRVLTFLRIELPLMLPTLFSAFLLVFLEIIKELPITLMLKPYNVETLTGRIYTYVHNEQYAEASIPGLIIIALGIIAVMITMLYKENKNADSK